jgi:hypothetical protein
MKQKNISIRLLPAKEQHLQAAFPQAMPATRGQKAEYLLRLLMVIFILFAVLATEATGSETTVKITEDVVLNGKFQRRVPALPSFSGSAFSMKGVYSIPQP